MNDEPVAELIEIGGAFVAGEGRLRDSFDAPVGRIDIRSRFGIRITVVVQIGCNLLAARFQSAEGSLFMFIGNLFQKRNTGISRSQLISSFEFNTVMSKFIKNICTILIERYTGIVTETVIPYVIL